MVKNVWPSKFETSGLSNFWLGIKTFQCSVVFWNLRRCQSSSAQLRENQVLRKDSGFPTKDIDFLWWSIKQRIEWKCKNFSKKEPRAKEYNCQVGERSSWYEGYFLDGRISCRLIFFDLGKFPVVYNSMAVILSDKWSPFFLILSVGSLCSNLA